MRRQAIASAVFGLAIGAAIHAKPAAAAWPYGGIITLPEASCSTSGSTRYCAFLHDSSDYDALENYDTYVDYHQTHGAGSISSSSCWQSYTGSAVTCGTAATTSTTGSQDVYIGGFASISGSEDYSDYFYVEVVSNSGDTIDSFYGIGYNA